MAATTLDYLSVVDFRDDDGGVRAVGLAAAAAGKCVVVCGCV